MSSPNTVYRVTVQCDVSMFFLGAAAQLGEVTVQSQPFALDTTDTTDAALASLKQRRLLLVKAGPQLKHLCHATISLGSEFVEMVF